MDTIDPSLFPHPLIININVNSGENEIIEFNDSNINNPNYELNKVNKETVA